MVAKTTRPQKLHFYSNLLATILLSLSQVEIGDIAGPIYSPNHPQ
jgi:hypothetical protein